MNESGYSEHEHGHCVFWDLVEGGYHYICLYFRYRGDGIGWQVCIAELDDSNAMDKVKTI
jgi:hypothetical protein